MRYRSRLLRQAQAPANGFLRFRGNGRALLRQSAAHGRRIAARIGPLVRNACDSVGRLQRTIPATRSSRLASVCSLPLRSPRFAPVATCSLQTTCRHPKHTRACGQRQVNSAELRGMGEILIWYIACRHTRAVVSSVDSRVLAGRLTRNMRRAAPRCKWPIRQSAGHVIFRVNRSGYRTWANGRGESTAPGRSERSNRRADSG